MTAHRGNAGDSVSDRVTPSDHLKPAPKPGSIRKHTPEAGAKIGSKGRTKGLTRRTPVKKRNAKRKGSRFPKVVDEGLREYVRVLDCCVWTEHTKIPSFPDGVCCWIGKCHPDHYRTRGAGGSDRYNLTPLCANHHRERHDLGVRSFQARYGLDLGEIAQRVTEDYLAAHPQRDTPHE